MYFICELSNLSMQKATASALDLSHRLDAINLLLQSCGRAVRRMESRGSRVCVGRVAATGRDIILKVMHLR